MDTEGNEATTMQPFLFFRRQSFSSQILRRTVRLYRMRIFFKIYDEKALEFILVSKGTAEDAYMLGRVAVSEYSESHYRLQGAVR